MILYITQIIKMNTQPPFRFFHMYANSVKITQKLHQNIYFSINIDTRIKTIFELSVHSGLEWVFSLPKISKFQKKKFLKLVHSTPKRREKIFFFWKMKFSKFLLKFRPKSAKISYFSQSRPTLPKLAPSLES